LSHIVCQDFAFHSIDIKKNSEDINNRQKLHVNSSVKHEFNPYN
jgi:hypothetical protein